MTKEDNTELLSGIKADIKIIKDKINNIHETLYKESNGGIVRQVIYNTIFRKVVIVVLTALVSSVGYIMWRLIL